MTTPLDSDQAAIEIIHCIESQGTLLHPVASETQNNDGIEPIGRFRQTSISVRLLYGNDGDGIFRLFRDKKLGDEFISLQREWVSNLAQSVDLSKVTASIGEGFPNWQQLAESVSYNFSYLDSNYRPDKYPVGKLGILTGFRFISEQIKANSYGSRDKTIWVHFEEKDKQQLIWALECSLQTAKIVSPELIDYALTEEFEQLKTIISSNRFPSLDIQKALEKFLSSFGIPLVHAELLIQQLAAEERFREKFESESLPLAYPETQIGTDESPRITLTAGYSENLSSNLLERRARRSNLSKAYLRDLAIYQYGLFGIGSNYVYYKSHLQSGISSMQTNSVGNRYTPEKSPFKTQWEVVEEEFNLAYQKLGIPLPSLENYSGKEHKWLFYGKLTDQEKLDIILIYDLLNRCVNAIQPQITQISPEAKSILAVVAETLAILQDEERMGYLSPFKNDYFTNLYELIRDHLLDNEEIKPITLQLSAETPMVLVGANGGGKTRLVGNLLEKFVSLFKIPAQRIIAPAELSVLAVADSTSEGENKTLATFWGRGKGKSSFITEIVALVERLNIIQNYKGTDPLLVAGDEINRRTDQLNATALAAAEILLLWKRKHISIFTSHSVWLPQKVGQLFRSLGINVNWNTMVDYAPTPISDGNIVSSRAYEETFRFVGSKLRKFVDEEILHRGDNPPLVEIDEHSSSKIAMETSRNRGPEKEFLRQLGWIQLDGYGREKIIGLPEYLVGLRYERDPAYLSLKCGHGENVIPVILNTVLNTNWERINEVPTLLKAIRNNRKRAEDVFTVLGGIVVNHEKIRSISIADDRYRSNQIQSYFQKDWQTLRDSIATLKKINDEDLKLFLPSVTPQEMERFVSTVMELEIPDVPSEIELDKILKLLGAYLDPCIIACSLEALAINSDNEMFCDVSLPVEDNPNDLAAIEIVEGYGFGLRDIIESRRASQEYQAKYAQKNGTEFISEEIPELVPNSVKIGTHIGLTGPQGSGKTEALFAIAESCMSAELWGIGTAKKVVMNRGSFRVIPLISVPDRKNPESRPLSSFELEVANRIRFIEDYVENLPEGIAPILIMDEPLSTTGTSEASPIIGGLLEYIKSKRGRVVFATHSHESVWDFENAHPGELTSMQVGMFNTKDRFKLTPGHGESMGLEVAEIHGIPVPIANIARTIRNYLLETRDLEIIPEDILSKYQTELQLLIQEI